MFAVFLKRKNIDLIRENLSLKKRVTRKENYLKITSLKKKEITNKLRGAKSATTKLKNQLKEKLKVVNTKYSLADTFAHGKNGANQRTAMFMACIRYLQHACLLSSQKTPIAFHLIFNILFDCSPPANLVVSPTTLSDWNVLLGEADKLILLKRFRTASMIFTSGVMIPTKGGKKGIL